MCLYRRYRTKPVNLLAQMPLDDRPGGTLDMLCLLLRWASKFGFDLMDVATAPRPRQDLLQAHLVLCTRHLMRRDTPAAWASVVVLWSHQFSALMPEPDEEARMFQAPVCAHLARQFAPEDRRLPYDAMIRIAENQYPPKSDWPWVVTTLGQLLHSTASPDMVSKLVCRDSFWDDLRNLPFYDHGASIAGVWHRRAPFLTPGMACTTVVLKILATPNLSHTAQWRLLSLSHVGLLRTPPGTQLEHLVSNLSHALRQCASMEEVLSHVRVQGPFRDAVVRYYAKVCAPRRASAAPVSA